VGDFACVFLVGRRAICCGFVASGAFGHSVGGGNKDAQANGASGYCEPQAFVPGHGVMDCAFAGKWMSHD
jgi:hypothetical protein